MMAGPLDSLSRMLKFEVRHLLESFGTAAAGVPGAGLRSCGAPMNAASQRSPHGAASCVLGHVWRDAARAQRGDKRGRVVPIAPGARLVAMASAASRSGTPTAFVTQVSVTSPWR